MAASMKFSPFLLFFFLALAVTHNANVQAKQPLDTASIASVVMPLCSPYQEGKKNYDMKCTRKLTDGLKETSEEAKKFIESADNKAICTGNENESSLLRFDSACNVFGHLCDFMLLGELKTCPEVQPLIKKKGPVKRNTKNAVAI